MPTLLLLGPRFDQVDRNHQCTGQGWSQLHEELVARDQRLSELLPKNAKDMNAQGLAYFINGRRSHGENLFRTTLMPDDEVSIVNAISGG